MALRENLYTNKTVDVEEENVKLNMFFGIVEIGFVLIVIKLFEGIGEKWVFHVAGTVNDM